MFIFLMSEMQSTALLAMLENAGPVQVACENESQCSLLKALLARLEKVAEQIENATAVTTT